MRECRRLTANMYLGAPQMHCSAPLSQVLTRWSPGSIFGGEFCGDLLGGASHTACDQMTQDSQDL
jgi:hypothetical protein